MDIASLIGLVGTLGMIAGAMVSSGGIGAFIDTFNVNCNRRNFFCSNVQVYITHISLIFWNFSKVFLPGVKKHDELITRITELAGIARKDGMMALEGQEVPDKFLKRVFKCLLMVLMKQNY